MTNTNMTAAQLAAENNSRLDYLGDTIPVTCNCGDYKDVVSGKQYEAERIRVLNSLCPNCKKSNV